MVLTIQGSTQVKVVRSLYTEVSNVPHVARGRVSMVFVLIARQGVALSRYSQLPTKTTNEPAAERLR